MSECRATYQGDEALQRLLKKQGVEQDMAAVRALVEGVVAAPQAEDQEAWVQLVVPAPSPALKAQLLALATTMRAEQTTRAGQGPSRPERLRRLWVELDKHGLTGFIVPRGDEHQGEYVPPRAERLAWLTGFTGSAGTAVVLKDKAAIFVDGRYTLQVRDQVDPALYEYRHLVEEPPWSWLAAQLKKSGTAIGYDPWLHTLAERERYAAAASKAAGRLIPCDGNPIDAIWVGQPAPPISPIVPHPIEYAGQPSAEKRAAIAATLTADSVNAAVLTAPDSIAWLLNIRGADVPHTPLPLSFALLYADGAVELFCDPRKLAPGLSVHLGNGVTTRPREAFPAALDRFGQAGQRVSADPDTAAAFIFDRLERAGAEVIRSANPCALPKACKNPVELEGMRAAHRRDGAALVRFLAWIKQEAPKGCVSEIEAAERLHAIRREDALFRDLSFATISGAGPNGAVVHYRVTEATDRHLEPGQLYLVDSGAQYLDGTTDVTRTLAIGTPSPEMRDRFTRVLKGHISLATARFPEGTTGSQLDTLARVALWQAGLDFDHGTGHGVGSYLGVHEGPQRISKTPNTVALKPGMIVSNEPGYYKTGEYGIRIENLIVVTPGDGLEGAERKMLRFETLTLAPFDLDLIEPNLMTREEIAWLNIYHARVRDVIGPLVDQATARWLEGTARTIGA